MRYFLCTHCPRSSCMARLAMNAVVGPFLVSAVAGPVKLPLILTQFWRRWMDRKTIEQSEVLNRQLNRVTSFISASHCFIASLHCIASSHRSIASLHRIVPLHRSIILLHRIAPSHLFIVSLHRIASSHRSIASLHRIAPSHRFIATLLLFIRPFARLLVCLMVLIVRIVSLLVRSFVGLLFR